MNAGAMKWAVTGAMLVAASWATAQSLGVPRGRWWERPRVAARLALTEEQKVRLDGIAVAGARVMIDLKAEVDKAELDLKAVADTSPFPAAKVRDAFRALQQARSRLESERFEMLLRLREVLSTQQWRQLQELKVERLQELGEGSTDDRPREPKPGRPRRP